MNRLRGVRLVVGRLAVKHRPGEEVVVLRVEPGPSGTADSLEDPSAYWDDPKGVEHVETSGRGSQTRRHAVGKREPERDLRVERCHLDDEPAMGSVVNVTDVDPAR